MSPDLLAFALVLLDVLVVALILTAALLVPIALVRRLLPHRAEPTALRCCAVAGPAAAAGKATPATTRPVGCPGWATWPGPRLAARSGRSRPGPELAATTAARAVSPTGSGAPASSPTAQRFPSDRLAVAVYPLQYMGEEVVQDFV